MANLGLLCCRTCKQKTCLGKWLRREDETGFGFWRGSESFESLGLKTLNFLAHHVNHEILLVSSYNLAFEEELDGYTHVERELSSSWDDEAGESS